ncbi:hypothetical protein [Sandaracinus amylolyticus]|uniref:Uncharacterized protein n=1 Tax=Sandaracinus amylolyticus TaxID=927083 RepID=A0A0F6W8B7_9BACT|nr:hypothetical protein [Sandaracinus amylolyticus]AKF09980.1 hypothetical protein DB32_007129 [Sandaracinus amylolyticus]
MQYRALLLTIAMCLGACEEPEPLVCGGAQLEPLTLAAGGRAEIAMSAELAATLADVAVTGGADVWRDGDRIVVRAGYVATDATLSLRCDHGALDVPVTVEALSMTPLLQWSPSETPDAPPAREYFAWWIGSDRALHLYGGFVYQPRQFTPSTDAFRLDLGTLVWSRVAVSGTPPPPGGRVAAGPDGAILYFGGASITDTGLDTPPILARFVGGEGTLEVSPAASSEGAPGSYTGALVHDAARDRWLSVCGADTRALGIHCRVHAYTPSGGFTELAIEGTAPRGRYGFHYALDAANDRVIVFAGQVGPGDLDIGGDTWALELASDPPRWEQLFASSDGIAPRRNGAYALDPEGRRLFVWGGTSDGRTAVPGLEVLELDRGRERWIHVELPASIPPRASGAGVLDPEGRRILWGFGNEARLYTDLYALELAPRDGI